MTHRECRVDCLFFNSVQCLDGHISPYFNKDTRDLFMLCIVFMCQLNCVLFIVVVRLFCSLFDFFIHSLFNFCSRSILLLFIHSLFVIQEKRFNYNPGLYPVISILLYHCTRITSSSMQVNKHHTSDCADFVLV